MTPDDFLISYTDLMEWVRSRLFAEQNPEYLLELAKFYGEMRVNNSDGVYHDDGIEQHVATKILGDDSLQAPVIAGTNQGTVLIASELYDSGGHSRVVWNWLKSFQDERSHSLLITRKVPERFEDSLKISGYSYHLCSSQGTELVREIIKYCEHARRIVLHIHPDDIISATAAKYLARAGKDVIFFNHADNLFSYGISSASVVCEVSSYGIALNRRTKRTRKSCYLGIPIDIVPPDKLNEANEASRQAPIVLTCGASYKYQPAEVFFGDFIDRLLFQIPDVTIVLVGPTGREPWWADHAIRWGDSVRFLGVLPHDQYLKTMESAAVYVDSFPVPGGTAFPEALLNGQQVIGLQNPFQGYTPADELRVDTVERLALRAKDLLEGDTIARKDIEVTRIKALEAHSLNGFRNRVLAIYEGKCEACPWENLVSVDTYWMERTWKANTKLNPPVQDERLFILPISFCFMFLVKRYRFHRRYRYIAVASILFILRVFPAPLRNLVRRLSPTSI